MKPTNNYYQIPYNRERERLRANACMVWILLAGIMFLPLAWLVFHWGLRWI